MKLKEGQIWNSSNTEFRIIKVINIDNNTWVHYINEKTGQEYSCYQESFVSRFNQVLNR